MAEVLETVLKFTADVAGAKKAEQEVLKVTQETEKALTALGMSLEQVSQAMNPLRDTIKQAFGVALSAAKSYKSELASVRRSIGGHKSQYKKLVKQLEEGGKKIVKQNEHVAKSYTGISDSVGGIKNQFTGLIAPMTAAFGAANLFNKSMDTAKSLVLYEQLYGAKGTGHKFLAKDIAAQSWGAGAGQYANWATSQMNRFGIDMTPIVKRIIDAAMKEGNQVKARRVFEMFGVPEDLKLFFLNMDKANKNLPQFEKKAKNIQEIMQAWQEFQERTAGFQASILSLANALAQILIPHLEALMQAFGWLADFLSQNTMLLTALVHAIEFLLIAGLFQKILGFLTILKKAGSIFTTIAKGGAALGGIAKVIGTIGGRFLPIIGILMFLYDILSWLAQFRQWLSGDGKEDAKSYFSDIFGYIADAIKNWFTGASSVAESQTGGDEISDVRSPQDWAVQNATAYNKTTQSVTINQSVNGGNPQDVMNATANGVQRGLSRWTNNGATSMGYGGN